MFAEIDKTIIETIRENLHSVPKNAVVAHSGESPPKKTPTISVWNRGFTASEPDIASEGPTVGNVVRDEFNGDGKRVSFKLSSSPLRPLLSVEHPPEKLAREGEDFKTQYGEGLVKFFEPPNRGTKNVIVQYYGAKEASEIRRMRIKFQYYLDVWTAKLDETSLIVDDVVSELIKSRDYLDSSGIRIQLSSGLDLTQKDGVPEGLYCRRLEFSAETDVTVRLPISRIEKIEINRAQLPERPPEPDRRIRR